MTGDAGYFIEASKPQVAQGYGANSTLSPRYVGALKNIFNAIEIAPDVDHMAWHRRELVKLARKEEDKAKRDESLLLHMHEREALDMLATIVPDVPGTREVREYDPYDDSLLPPRPTVPPMLTGTELARKREAEYVQFWTGSDDPRNSAAEDTIIDWFLSRPNVLSIRSVRDSQIPWSIEIVGKRNGNIQHVRIICEHDSSDDTLNLPFEFMRYSDPPGISDQLGWGDHFDIDFLVFYQVQPQIVRLVNRAKFAALINESELTWQGIRRVVPRDPFKRVAHGVQVPLDIIATTPGVLLEEVYFSSEE